MGCGLMPLEPGELAAARRELERIGFRRHTGPKAHSEDRPVLVGSIGHDGNRFRLHRHLIPRELPEVPDQLHFRGVLRSRPARVAEYVAVKRALLARSVRDSYAYNSLTDPFIGRVIALDR